MSNIAAAEQIFEGKLNKDQVLDQIAPFFPGGRRPSERTFQRLLERGLPYEQMGNVKMFDVACVRAFFAGKTPSLPPPRGRGRPRRTKTAAEARP